MRSRFERRLKKEASFIKTPDLLASVYQDIGHDLPSYGKKWYANKLLWGAAAAIVLAGAVTAPVAVNSTNALYADSFISLTINPETSNTLKEASEESENKEASFSIQVSKKKEIKKLESNDQNSRIIRCGINQSDTDISGFIRNIIHSSAKTGFIDVSSKKNYISILVSSSNAKTAKHMKNIVSKAIINELSRNYIYGYLVDENNECDENYEVLAKNLDISKDKYILLQKVNDLYYGAFAEDYLSSLDYASLYELIAKANEAHYCCPDGYGYIMESLRVAKDAYFEESILPLMKELDVIQTNILQMQNSLNASLSKAEKETNKEYLSYDCEEEMHKSMSENAFDQVEPFDFWQMMIWNSPYTRSNTSTTENNTENDFTMDELITKIDESKSKISDIVAAVNAFSSIENQYEMPASENCAFYYTSNYSQLMNEHAGDAHDDDWITNYQNDYSDASDYWYHR